MSTQQVLNTVISTLVHNMSLEGEDLVKSLQLNATLCMLHPNIFDGVPHMNSPIVLIGDAPYMARMRKLKTEFNMTTFSEGVPDDFDPALQVINELVEYIADLKSRNKTYVPYIPLHIKLYVDATSYQPKVVFYTRFAILEEPDE